MEYAQAVDLYEQQWRSGKHAEGNHETAKCTFPYNYLYKNEIFVVVSINPHECKLQTTEDERVDKYIQQMSQEDQFGPSWVVYGKKLKTGEVHKFWHNLFYVLDGNHRMAARQKLNYMTVKVIMPQSSYDLYERLQ